MNIINTLPEYTKPKNVGLMFFSLEPERFFPYAQIDVVEFPDDSGSTIREKIFKGPIHQQLREALQYMKNSILQEQVVKVDGVTEVRRFFNYPYAAVLLGFLRREMAGVCTGISGIVNHIES